MLRENMVGVAEVDGVEYGAAGAVAAVGGIDADGDDVNG